MARVESLQLLKGEISRIEFVVGGNEPGAGTMGLMGRNLLSFTDTEYDLANGMIRFSFPNDDCAKANLAYWAGASHVTEINMERDFTGSKRPALRVRVKLNGTDLVALLDTGATTVVTVRAARRAGVTEAQMTPSEPIYGGGEGSAKSWMAPFARFDIGDEAITNNRLRVGDISIEDADLLLGIDFFLAHRIYVSKKQDKIFITYDGGTVFSSNRSGGVGAIPLDAGPDVGGAEGLSADQLARRAAALASRQEYERALTELSRAIELEPSSAAHIAQRGVILEGLRRPAEALASFDQALELDPGQTDARFRRAVLYLHARNRQGALSDLDVLDKALASQSNTRLAMSDLYLEMDRLAQALAQLNQWLPSHRNEVGRDAALNGRCWARAMLGIELDQALRDCNDAVASDPKNAAYLDSRGWVHLRLGWYQKAVADFERALAYRPGFALSLYGRGLAKSWLGDTGQAAKPISSQHAARSQTSTRG